MPSMGTWIGAIWLRICAAAVRSDTVMLIRLAELNTGAIKRALDIGADGVLIPWMETADQLRQAVAAAHFPPNGMRGIGAERATNWGQRMSEHVAEAEPNVLVIPMIESVRAGKNIESMLEVPGVEIFFFGPADYSSTAGYPGQWEGPGVGDTILAVKQKITSRGKFTGVIAANPDNLRQRKSQGFQMLAVGLDGMLMMPQHPRRIGRGGRRAGDDEIAKIRRMIRQLCTATAGDSLPATFGQ